MFAIFFLVLRSLAEPPFYCCIFASVLFIMFAYMHTIFVSTWLPFIYPRFRFSFRRVSSSIFATRRARHASNRGPGKNSKYISRYINIKNKKNTVFNIFGIETVSIPRLKYAPLFCRIFARCPDAVSLFTLWLSIPRHQLVATRIIAELITYSGISV